MEAKQQSETVVSYEKVTFYMYFSNHLSDRNESKRKKNVKEGCLMIVGGYMKLQIQMDGKVIKMFQKCCLLFERKFIKNRSEKYDRILSSTLLVKIM